MLDFTDGNVSMAFLVAFLFLSMHYFPITDKPVAAAKEGFRTVLTKPVKGSTTYQAPGHLTHTPVKMDPKMAQQVTNPQMVLARTDNYQQRYQNGMQNLMNNEMASRMLGGKKSNHYDVSSSIPVSHQMGGSVYQNQQPGYATNPMQHLHGTQHSFNQPATYQQNTSFSQVAVPSTVQPTQPRPPTMQWQQNNASTMNMNQLYQPSPPPANPLGQTHSDRMYGHMNQHTQNLNVNYSNRGPSPIMNNLPMDGNGLISDPTQQGSFQSSNEPAPYFHDSAQGLSYHPF